MRQLLKMKKLIQIIKIIIQIKFKIKKFKNKKKI